MVDRLMVSFCRSVAALVVAAADVPIVGLPGSIIGVVIAVVPCGDGLAIAIDFLQVIDRCVRHISCFVYLGWVCTHTCVSALHYAIPLIVHPEHEFPYEIGLRVDQFRSALYIGRRRAVPPSCHESREWVVHRCVLSCISLVLGTRFSRRGEPARGMTLATGVPRLAFLRVVERDLSSGQIGEARRRYVD